MWKECQWECASVSSVLNRWSEIGSSLGLDYQGADPESGYLMLFIYFLQAVWDLTELCQGPAVGLLCGQQC